MKKITVCVLLALLFAVGQFVCIVEGQSYNNQSQPSVPAQVDDKEMVVLQILICESPWDENGPSLAETLADQMANTTIATKNMFSRGSMSDAMTQLEQDGKLTILSRPQITALDRQKTMVLVGERDENGQDRGLFLELTPRVLDNQILTSLRLKYDFRNEQGEWKPFQANAAVTLQDGVPLLVGGLLFQSNSDTPTKEISLCLVGRIVKR